MKKIALLLLITFVLGAEETPSLEMDDSIVWGIPNFFTVEGDYDKIYSSDFESPNLDKIGFSEWNTGISYMKMFCGPDGLALGVSYTHTCLDWNENPYFTQKDFDNLNVFINGFSRRFSKVELKGSVSANMDTRYWNLSDTFILGTLWGRYELCTNWCGPVGLNFGATTRFGLKDSFVYPIFGIDFKPSEKLKVNLIFPIDMVVSYAFCPCWIVEVTGRLWNSRRRLSEEAGLYSRGYFEYRNSGLDIGLRYDWDPVATVAVHVGSTLGQGDIRISDTNERMAQKLSFDSALYFGAEARIRF